MNPKLRQFNSVGWPASFWAALSPRPPALAHRVMCDFCMSAGDSNSDPRHSIAGALTTESSPSPCVVTLCDINSCTAELFPVGSSWLHLEPLPVKLPPPTAQA